MFVLNPVIYMSRKVRNILVVSGSTLASRVLGLFRDGLIFSFFGTSLLNSAFVLAFTLPNLFRRLLGEGALTSAMIPVFTHALERKGESAAFSVFNQILTRLTVALVFLSVIGFGVIYGIERSILLPEKWKIAAELSETLLPYMVFICASAIVAAALNVLGAFAVGALSAAWLNLSMIGAMVLFGFLSEATEQTGIMILCYGVLFGGVLQLGIPLIQLWRRGWRPRIDFETSESVEEAWRLFLPGLLGAAIYQINLMVSRFLAFSLNDSATSVLYLASRLVEFPQGVFGIAIATVVFPELARCVAREDHSELAHSYAQGIRLVLAITLPSAVGLILLAQPILEALFQWGHFGSSDVAITAPVLMVYALTIPLFSVAILATRAFHACKDTKTPVHVAFVSFMVNVFSSFVLMHFLGTIGLALANVVSAVVHVGLLWTLVARKNMAYSGYLGFKPVVQVACATIIMAVMVKFGQFITHAFSDSTKMSSLLDVAFVIPVAGVTYFTALWYSGFQERYLIKTVWNRLFRRNRSAQTEKV